MSNPFHGVLPPIVTPMHENGDINHADLEAHVERLESGGVDGTIICGTNGERATLSPDEVVAAVETAVDAGSKRVIAGTGASSTADAIDLTRRATNAGADGAMIIYPYYSCPSNEHVIRHYKAIGDAVETPIMIYNWEEQGGGNTRPDSVVEMASHPNIRGIKESTSFDQLLELLARTEEMDFNVLAGYDSHAFPSILLGATGVTSVSANLFPEPVAEMVSHAKNEDIGSGLPIHQRLLHLEEGLGLDVPPIPTKAALEMLGHTDAYVRPPLYELSDDRKQRLRRILDQFQS